MRKSILSMVAFSAILIGFSSCKKEKVELGTVTLDPATKTVSYGDVYSIKPTFSTAGEAKDKAYKWTSNADSIASIKTATGGVGEVTAKRIGEAIITFESTDGLIKKTSQVIVEPRSNLLNGLYYSRGASESNVKNNILAGFTLTASESTSTSLVFTATSATNPITKLIYMMEDNGLKAVNVILNNSTTVQQDAKNYMEERFKMTGITKSEVTYYRNTGYIATNSVPINTVMGIFLNQEIDGKTYPLGIRITDFSYIR